jgi:hypothetical protein
MITVSRVQAGYYSASDGRAIVKEGGGWYVLNKEGNHDFGPVTTLSAAKQYLNTGSITLGNGNTGTAYGRRQSKKDFHSYLAAEAKSGNPFPAILWLLIVFGICFLLFLIRGY